jgi:ketosteroid isomerase-like protein
VKKHRNQPWVLAISVLALAGCGGESEGAGRAAIQQQIAKYTAALDAADTDLAAQVWDTTGEISFINPVVHSHGWEEIQGAYAFFRSAYSERKLTVRDVSIHMLGDAAWAEFNWHFTGRQSDGAVIESDGRESQVYRRTGGRWALVHVHYSAAPAEPPAAGQ